MSEGTAEPVKTEEPSLGSELQFDKVELPSAQAARTCPGCQKLIGAEYYEVAGNVICPSCAAALGSGKSVGSFLRALAYGGGAALVSTIVWYAIIKATDSEWGIVAIGVGLFVGYAVRKAVRGTGGVRYQVLAMALTYAAITWSKVPLIVDQVTQSQSQSESASVGGAAVAPRTAAAPPASEDPTAPSLGSFLVAWGLIFGIALLTPFLAGFDGIIGLLIIGIALYEAWKLNRRVPVSGPFRLGSVA